MDIESERSHLRDLSLAVRHVIITSTPHFRPRLVDHAFNQKFVGADLADIEQRYCASLGETAAHFKENMQVLNRSLFHLVPVDSFGTPAFDRSAGWRFKPKGKKKPTKTKTGKAERKAKAKAVKASKKRNRK